MFCIWAAPDELNDFILRADLRRYATREVNTDITWGLEDDSGWELYMASVTQHSSGGAREKIPRQFLIVVVSRAASNSIWEETNTMGVRQKWIRFFIPRCKRWVTPVVRLGFTLWVDGSAFVVLWWFDLAALILSKSDWLGCFQWLGWRK
jgi:hypothetical protein